MTLLELHPKGGRMTRFWRPRSTARHRTPRGRIRRLEKLADNAEAEHAALWEHQELSAAQAAEDRRHWVSLEQRVGELEALAFARQLPLGGEVPVELATAIASGSGEPVMLEADGTPVIVVLDEHRPGEAAEIWHAAQRAGRGDEGLVAS
jgi:hypothetical protein